MKIAPAYDLYNVTKDTWIFSISESTSQSTIISNVHLGMGVDLDDPTHPELALLGPFAIPPAVATPEDDPIPVDTITTASTSFIEDTSDYEFAQQISANLSASFNFASASAAYDYVKNIRTHSDIILAIIVLSTTENQLPRDHIHWAQPPSSESDSISDDDERLHQFISDYGSHYIQSLLHGYRMSVYGKLDTKTESTVMDFKAAFHAAFSGGGASGGMTDSQKETMSSSHVELRAQITAGKTQPEQSPLLYGFNEIYPFLEKVRTGAITIFPGPIKASGKSYWHTLMAFPKTRAVLAENRGEAPEAPFGVPAGTIISWAPPRSSIRTNAEGQTLIIPPNGWAICDGSMRTPNLMDRFVMGTATVDEIAATGGAATYELAGGTEGDRYTPGDPGPGGFSTGLVRHVHKLQQQVVSIIPPYVKLIYIMKEY